MYTGSPSPDHSICTAPPSMYTLTGLWARFVLTAATATAQEPEPEARVSPAPRSQILILTSCLPRANPNSTFVFSGKTGSASMGGPTVERSRVSTAASFSRKATACGLPIETRRKWKPPADLGVEVGSPHVHPRRAVVEEEDFLDPSAGGDAYGFAPDHTAVLRVARQAAQAVT